MLRTVRSRAPQSRRALPAGADYRLRTALRSLLAFKPSAVEMYANTSNAGLRRRVRTVPAVPFVSLDTPTDAPPAPKWASFTGGDGQYNGLISRPQLLLPLRVLDAIIYQVDIASDTAFTANLETISEGQSRAFNKGGYSTVNRYGRVRAKFPSSAWTGWTVFGVPTAVASGTVPTGLGDLTGDLDDVADSASRFAAIAANADETLVNTAANISGQGALATKANVDLATAEVLNKSADNIAEAASRKWLPTLNRIFATQAQKDAAMDVDGNLLLKNIQNASGVTSAPSTASSTFSTLAEMTKTFTSKGSKVLLIFDGYFIVSGTNPEYELRFVRDSTVIGKVVNLLTGVVSRDFVSFQRVDTGASAASHTWKVEWRYLGTGGTVSAVLTNREIQVVELG